MATPSRGKNGILSVPAAATKKNSKAEVPGRQPSKAGTPRLRLIIRRLAPGLTEAEFWTALGEEWKAGSERLTGQLTSKESPSKPSKPSRAYLKVKEPQMLDQLAVKVKQTPFQDAKNTTKDPCLLGPPSLEFALYTRVPGNRVRHDGRQGTIDQDQEFIDFLQSLTEPVTKATNDASVADGKQEKGTITPLVQFLKEKKATKAREAAAAAKTAKAKEVKEAKAEKPEKTTVVVKNNPTSMEKSRVTKATQDAVKAINKSVASMQRKASPQKMDPKSAPTTTLGKESATPQVRPPRERGSAIIANRILQRDLGITPRDVKSRGARISVATKNTEVAPKDIASASNIPNQSATKSSPEKSTAASTAPPAGPRNAKPPSAAAMKPNIVPAARPSKPLPHPTTGARSAFLKHANASQGVTEDLLRTVFETFGPLTKCEIDKKKGFGYVDFADTEGLVNAMQASPVKVGNSQVVVLENKTRRATPVSAVSTTAPTNTQTETHSTIAASNLSVNADPPSTPAVDSTGAGPSYPLPQKDPRGGPRSGPVFNRGRGGFSPGRGSFPVQRGAVRGNFRGGRGNTRGVSTTPAVESPAPSTTPHISTTTSNATGGAGQS